MRTWIVVSYGRKWQGDFPAKVCVCVIGDHWGMFINSNHEFKQSKPYFICPHQFVVRVSEPENVNAQLESSVAPSTTLTGATCYSTLGQDLCRLITLVEKNKRMATKWVTRVRFRLLWPRADGGGAPMAMVATVVVNPHCQPQTH